MRSNERTRMSSSVRLIGLVEEVVGARIERLLVRAEIAQRRQEQDRRVADDGQHAHLAAGLEAVHPRHQHVQQHQVGAVLLDQLQRLRAAFGLDRVVARGGEVPLGDLPVGEVVVDDEDA